MALWTSSYPVDTGDRDPNFAWHDTDVPSAGLDDSQHDLFAQFLDFEAGHGSTSSAAVAVAEPFYMDPSHHHHHPHHHAHGESSTTSSGVSNADDFDFLSASSNPGTAGYDVDPSTLAMFAQDPAAMYSTTSGVTVSDTELERLEGISLHSPKKGDGTFADRAASPTPVAAPAIAVNATTNTANTTTNARRSKKLVDALSSTFRKATTMRKTRKVSQALQRAVSPSMENPPMAIKPGSAHSAAPVPRGRRAHRAHTQHALQHQQHQHQQAHQISESPPMLQINTGLANSGGFVAGQFEDPFGGEISPTHAPQPQPQPPQMRYYSQGGLGTPLDSPTRSAAMLQQQWQQQQQQQQQQQHHNGAQQQQWSAASSQQDLWWGGAAGGGAIDAKNIDANMAMHSQHGELPYDVHADAGRVPPNGLLIHMPQPRPGSSSVHDLSLNAHTYLPPPPPVPAENTRSARPPRAPSSGARHHHRTTSSSPMRKQRGTSVSPSPGGSGSGNGGGTRQSRHSSGGSAASSSQRSASGRLSVPGTPSSSGIKKRRSRDAGSGSFSADEAGGFTLVGGGGGGRGGGGGGGIGFVNFTPNDGGVLMTGVAPSGSSKTKARREKEAQERRRRLSEAAMKAVAAAGGDIRKLREQGFEL